MLFIFPFAIYTKYTVYLGMIALSHHHHFYMHCTLEPFARKNEGKKSQVFSHFCVVVAVSLNVVLNFCGHCKNGVRNLFVFLLLIQKKIVILTWIEFCGHIRFSVSLLQDCALLTVKPVAFFLKVQYI